MVDNKLGRLGEVRARRVLALHFTHVRYHATPGAPFDYTAIDRLTGERIAVEVKTVRVGVGKLVHIEMEAFRRKLAFLYETNRKGIVLIVVHNGEDRFFLAPLKQHISMGHCVELVTNKT